MGNGKFIVIEGIDGSGISTQVELLRIWFKTKGLPAFITKEPTRSPIGGLLDGALQHRIKFRPEVMALLFTGDRLDHLENEIGPSLGKGDNVISDRYYLSGLAYQSIEVDLQWLRALNSACPVPTLTIFLDVPVELSLERSGSDYWRSSDRSQLYEEEETRQRVRDNFLKIISLLKDEGEKIQIVDGTGTALEVSDRVRSVVADLFPGTSPQLPDAVLERLSAIHEISELFR